MVSTSANQLAADSSTSLLGNSYENNNFKDWRRIVSGKGNAKAGLAPLPAFRRFFDEFLASNQILDDFKPVKPALTEIDPTTETELRNSLLWCGDKLGTQLFERVMHIARTTADAVNLHDKYF